MAKKTHGSVWVRQSAVNPQVHCGMEYLISDSPLESKGNEKTTYKGPSSFFDHSKTIMPF